MKGFKFGLIVFLSIFMSVSQVLAATYQIDNAHSQIGFATKHLMVSTTQGHFKDYTGQIEFDANNLESFAADVTIQAASIDTDNQDRDNHLRSADFFDVANNPMMTFKGEEIRPAGDGYEIVGDLTIKGVTKEITIPVTISGPVTSPYGDEVIGLSGQTTINRQDFGVSWNKMLDGGGLVVDDKVKISVEIEAKKAK